MKDNEIIKALECCSKILMCDDCSYVVNGCSRKLKADALELIKRQQAKIDQFADIGKMYSEIKIEAFQEVAERLKNEFVDPKYPTDWVEIKGIDFISTVDELVKEMKEELNI